MTDQNPRRLPDGIPSFEMIRERGYVYVDKTDLIWRLTHDAMFNYLSRPRRFGKSILVDTLACYFEGRKDLFEGLKIMELEKDWNVYPVVRFDMSEAEATEEGVRRYFNRKFREIEHEHHIPTYEGDTLTDRFATLLRFLCEEKGRPVAVLIDEYDSPLQHSWHTEEHEHVTEVYRNILACLKSCSRYEQFVFLTGITKFTQISLFSVLNNLNNISFYPEYATLCGITKEEIEHTFQPEIARMEQANGWTGAQTVGKLQANYDGYHFSDRNMTDVFNPYSVIMALSRGHIGNYWASSGSTSLIPKFVDDMELHIRDYEHCIVSRTMLESSDVNKSGPAVFLYQSGYLTIKGFDESTYFLGIPNSEVRQALYEVVLPALAMRKESDIQNAQGQLLYHLNYANVDEAMHILQALVADVPYSNKKLQSMDMEERYRFIISSIFYALGLNVQAERMMAKGRIDLVAWSLHAIYVIELKLTQNGGLAAAQRQMEENMYAEPFRGDGREVVPLVIELDNEGKGILNWKTLKH